MLSRWNIREPFCGLSHGAGACLSVVGLVGLLIASQGKPWHLTAYAIYGVSLIFLFTASTLYHSLHGDQHRIERLQALDQVAIFGLIAGTYTPVCLLALRGAWGYGLLAVVWGLAFVGAALRIGLRKCPAWLPFALYLLMGWLCVVAMGPISQALAGGGMAWLFAGGLMYTVGAVVMATDRPRLWPGRFGSHDLWHVLVLGGSAAHDVMILFFVRPA